MVGSVAPSTRMTGRMLGALKRLPRANRSSAASLWAAPAGWGRVHDLRARHLLCIFPH